MSLTLSDIDATLAKLRAQKADISERIAFYVALRKQELVACHPVDPYQDIRGSAREEHAFRLREEGFTFAIISERLGVSINQARQLSEAYKRHGSRDRSIEAFKRPENAA